MYTPAMAWIDSNSELCSSGRVLPFCNLQMDRVFRPDRCKWIGEDQRTQIPAGRNYSLLVGIASPHLAVKRPNGRSGIF